MYVLGRNRLIDNSEWVYFISSRKYMSQFFRSCDVMCENSWTHQNSNHKWTALIHRDKGSYRYDIFMCVFFIFVDSIAFGCLSAYLLERLWCLLFAYTRPCVCKRASAECEAKKKLAQTIKTKIIHVFALFCIACILFAVSGGFVVFSVFLLLFRSMLYHFIDVLEHSDRFYCRSKIARIHEKKRNHTTTVYLSVWQHYKRKEKKGKWVKEEKRNPGIFKDTMRIISLP